MSGRIWDHLPAMLPHFEEEGIPVPTFTGFQMADLIAYEKAALCGQKRSGADSNR